jgi:hypothetical protein
MVVCRHVPAVHDCKQRHDGSSAGGPIRTRSDINHGCPHLPQRLPCAVARLVRDRVLRLRAGERRRVFVGQNSPHVLPGSAAVVHSLPPKRLLYVSSCFLHVICCRCCCCCCCCCCCIICCRATTAIRSVRICCHYMYLVLSVFLLYRPGWLSPVASSGLLAA